MSNNQITPTGMEKAYAAVSSKKCHGCQTEFDSEARSSAVYLCNHSLCTVCLNKKVITPGFKCKKPEISIVELNNDDGVSDRLAPSTKADDTPDPVLLSPEFIPFLHQIVNKLDPADFAKFARTCKTVHDVCFNTKGINITYTIPFMALTYELESLYFTVDASSFDNMDDTDFFEAFVHCSYCDDPREFFASPEYRKRLKNYPFTFRLDELNLSFCQVNEASIVRIRSFFSEFAIKSIRKVETSRYNLNYHEFFEPIANDIKDWKGFSQLVKDFGVEDVELYSFLSEDDDELQPIPEEVANYLVHNYDRFRSDRPVSDNVIINASVPHLYLTNTFITKETFLALISRLANSTEDFVWKIGRQPFEFGHYDMFEAVNLHHDEAIDGPLPETRPLVFFDRIYDDVFDILRKDGKRMKICGYYDYVIFSSSEQTYQIHRDSENDLYRFF